MHYTAIIADDEQKARNRLQRLVGECCPNINIIATAQNGIEALECINRHKPDLAILDIEMPGMNGIEAANAATHSPFIIFVTAYDHYAIKAFKTMAVDYILKPVSSDQIRSAYAKFEILTASRPHDNNALLAKITEDVDKPALDRLQLRVGNTVKFIPLEKIICIDAANKYTIVHTLAGEFITEYSLAELEKILPSKDFVRIHRKTIVNLSFVDRIVRLPDRKGKVVLTVPLAKEIFVSRGCKAIMDPF